MADIQSHDAVLHFERWTQAQQLMRDFTTDSWKSAEIILDDMLEVDPKFVRGLSMRASIETMRHIAFPGVNSSAQVHEKALRWAAAATMEDPMDSRAQLALGWACAMSRQFSRGEVAYELTFQNNENDPWTIVSSAVGFAFCDNPERAQELLGLLVTHNLVLEPVHWSYLAAIEFVLGNYPACIAASEQAQEISTDVPAWHAAALALTGDHAQARLVKDRFVALAQDRWEGDAAPSESHIWGWLLAAFPIKSRETWVNLREGLARTGADLPG